MTVSLHPKNRARLEALVRQRRQELARVDPFFDPATMAPTTRKMIEQEAARRGMSFDAIRALLHLNLFATHALRLAEAERDLAAFD